MITERGFMTFVSIIDALRQLLSSKHFEVRHTFTAHHIALPKTRTDGARIINTSSGKLIRRLATRRGQI